MTPATARGLVRRVGPDPEPSADADLVGRFTRSADPAAFAALVRRHGPMVLAACRRMLPAPDADDAFQAVFLVLLRKAAAVRPAGAVGGWLHGVAVRTAQKARVAAARRRRREMTRVLTNAGRPPGETSMTSAEHAELRAVLDEELAKLPEPLRAAVVLCDLAGKTRAEAAADLGCPEGTVAARVHRARKALAERLTRRGVTAPAVVAAAAVPAELLAAVAGFADGGAVPSAVRALADGVVRSMVAQPLSLAFAALAAVAVAAGALWAAGPAPSEAAAPAADPPAGAAHAVIDLSFNADGTRYVALFGGTAAVKDAATDRTLWVARAEAARFTRTPAGRDDLTTLTPDGVVLRGAADGRPHGRTAPRPKADAPWRAVRFSPDASRYAAHTGTGVRVFETTSGTEPLLLAELHGPGDRAAASNLDVMFSPDGSAVFGLGVMVEPGNVGTAEWDATSGHRRRATGGDPRPTAAAYSPDSDTIAIGYADRVVLYSNGKNDPPPPPDAAGRERTTLRKHQQLAPAAPVTALAYSPDGKVVAAGVRGGDGKLAATVQLFDAATGKELRRLGGFAADAPVTALAFSPDGKTLLAGTGGGEINRFDLAAPPPAAPAAHVTGLAFAPDGKTYLVVGGGHATVKDTATDRVRWTAPAMAARFTADGAAVLTMGKDVERRAAATGEAQTSARRAKAELGWHVVAFAPDGARYAAHDGFAARLYDTATGAEPVRLTPEFGIPGGAVLRPGGKDVLFSPDGKWVAAVGVLLTATEMGAAVWDAETGKRALVYPPPGNLGQWVAATAAAFSADGKTLAVAVEKRVHVFDTAGFKHRDTLPDTPGSGPVTALAFAPDGKSLAVGYRLPLLHGGDKEPKVVGHKTEVQVIDLATKKERRRFDGFEGVRHMGPTILPVTALAFSPDGQTLLAGTGLAPLEAVPGGALPPGEVKRFTLADPPAKGAAPAWREKAKLPPFEDRVHSVAFSPDGKQLAVGGRGGAAQHTVTMWDAARRLKLWAGGPVPAGTTSVSFSPDGKLLAATRDKTTGVYDARTGQPVPMNPPLPGGTAVAYSPDGKHLAITEGKRLVVVPAAGGAAVFDRPLADEPLADTFPGVVAWSPDGTRLVVPWRTDFGKAEFGADVWSLQTRKAKALIGHPAQVTAAAWSPDGKTVATGCGKGDVIFWDAATLKELRRTRLGGRGGEGVIRALAFAPDGRTLAAAFSMDEGPSADRVAFLDPATGERAGRDLAGFTNLTPVALAFAPDGRTLAVGMSDFLPTVQGPPGGEPRPLGSVVLFTTDPEPKAPPAPAAPLPEDVSLAPDGKAYLFVHDGRVQLADAATDRVRWDAPAVAARFSPDGKTVLTLDDAVARRDAETGKLLKEVTLPKNTKPVRAAAFSPDGKLFAVQYGTFAQVFDAATGFERARLGPDPIIPDAAAGPAAAMRLAWSPDSKRLAVVGLPTRRIGGRGVTLWDGTVRHGVELDGFPAAEARAAAFSPDGKTLAVATQHDVYVWADGAKAPRREALLGDIGAVGFLPDGRLVAAGEGRYADGKSDPPVYQRRLFAHVVDPKQAFGGLAAIDKAVRPDGAAPVTALAVSPDGKAVLVSSGGGVTRLTFAEAAAQADPPAVWAEKATLAPVPEPIQVVAFRPDGKELAAGGRATVHHWSVPDYAEGPRFGHDPLPTRVAPVAYSPDGKVVGLAIPGGVMLYDAATWRPLADMGAKGAPPLAGPTPLALTFGLPGPGGAGRPRYKAATADGASATVYTWVEGGRVSTTTFARPKDAPKLDDPAAGVAFMPSGEQLVFIPNVKDAAGRWVAQVWGGGGQGKSHVLPHGPAPLTAVAWSPDYKHVATGCRKGDVVIWDATTFKELRRVALTGRMGEGVVHALAFSPDGKTLAAAVDLIDGKNVDRVVLLDPATGSRAARDIQGFDNAEPRALAFSPDGKTLAVGCTAYRVENARRTGDHGLVKLYAAGPGG